MSKLERHGPPVERRWLARSPALAAGALLGLLVLAAFWPMLGHEFVNCDDDVYVTANARVQRGLTWPNVTWAFTTTDAEFWHPLTWLSHLADCQFYSANARGHHLSSLLLHVANTLLAFFALKRLTGSLWRSWVVAALFGLHPLHVESVAWVAERKDLLSMFFFLLTLWAYARFVEKKGESIQYSVFSIQCRKEVVWYCVALTFFTCGLMSKPMLVTLPFVLLLLDFWPLRRWGLNTEHWILNTFWPLVQEKGWFFLLAFAGSALAYAVQHGPGSLSRTEEFPVGLRVANAVVSYVRYLGKTIWPSDLAVFYPYPQAWAVGLVGGGALLLAGVTVGAVWKMQRRPYVAVGWFWFLGTLVPVIGLVQVGRHAMADRYTYLPLVGLFFMLVWLVADLMPLGRRRGIVLACLSVAVLGACFCGARRQLGYWQNSEALARRALAVTAGNYVAHNNLASVLVAKGKLDEARGQYQAALAIRTNFAPAQSNLGLLLEGEGRSDEAREHFVAALRSEPGNATVHYLLAGLLDQQGNAQEAFGHYQEAARLRPDFAEAFNALGCMAASQGKWNEAGVLFSRAVQSNPDYAEAHNNLGTVSMNSGNLEDAAKEFATALRLKPGYADAHCNLGKALYYQHKGSAAVEHFVAALKAKPDWVEALDLLARILAASPEPRTRNGTEALRLAARAVELTKTNDAKTLDTLAAAYAETGHFEEAVLTARKALEATSGSGQKDLSVQIEGRVEMYRSQRPLRE